MLQPQVYFRKCESQPYLLVAKTLAKCKIGILNQPTENKGMTWNF